MKTLADKKETQKIIQTMAQSISQEWKQFEKDSKGSIELVLVGIRARGVPLAERLTELIKSESKREVNLGILDITLYRDDLSLQNGKPLIKSTDIPFSIEGTLLYIVDDVLYTGRTIRAAMDALFDLGRPQAIKLAVLVDRQGRELPIQADVVGIEASVKPAQIVNVRLTEIDGEDEIIIHEI